MSETVYKYQFRVTDRFMLTLPAGARILAVQMQQGIPSMWVQVNPKADGVTRFFRVLGTGHPMDDGVTLHYLGTFQIQDTLVFRLYEADADSSEAVQEPRDADSENRDGAITKAVGEVRQDEGPRGEVAAVEQAGKDS